MIGMCNFPVCFCILHRSLSMSIEQGQSEFRRVIRGGEGGRSSLPFSKVGKKCPNFEIKRPDCGHLWVKFMG